MALLWYINCHLALLFLIVKHPGYRLLFLFKLAFFKRLISLFLVVTAEVVVGVGGRFGRHN